MRDSGVAGTGLVFHFLPPLFERMALGRPLAVFFFLALSFAAFSSYLPGIELLLKTFLEKGYKRSTISIWVCVLFLLFSLPSALSVSFLANQVRSSILFFLPVTVLPFSSYFFQSRFSIRISCLAPRSLCAVCLWHGLQFVWACASSAKLSSTSLHATRWDRGSTSSSSGWCRFKACS